MKKILLSLAMLAISLHGFAQHEVHSLTFIPKLGVNLANIQGDDMYYHWQGSTPDGTLLKSKYRIGVVAGIEGEYQMSKPLSLSVGALYSLQGNQYDDIEFQRNYSSTLHTVNVPVLLNFYVVKGLALKVGLQAGYAFYKKTSYDSFIDGHWLSSSTSASIYKPFDISVPVGISYDFNKLRVDLRYNYGLTSISRVDGMPSVSNRVVQLSFGYCLGK